MGLQRVQRTVPSHIVRQVEMDGELVAADGSVDVTVTDGSGATVAAGPATSVDVGTYRFLLPGQPDLGLLTATWEAQIDGTPVVLVDPVEVAGAHWWTLAAGRASDGSLADTDRYPPWRLAEARVEAEIEAEMICDRALVPRYARVVVDGSGTGQLVLPHPDPDRTLAHIRRIRSAAVTAADGTTTAFTVQELAALAVTDDAVVRRPPGSVWVRGYGNVTIELEYGLDAPPPDLVRAALTAFRVRVHQPRSNIPDRASSFTSAEGGTYRLDMPGAARTGIPAVDAVYARYSRRARPASRSFDFDPQHGSLFHGGRR